MELKSKEVIERIRDKMHLIEKNKLGSNAYGMTHLDIVCEDNSIKQYILAFERYEVIEPPVFLKLIGSDVYIKIKDKTLYKIASKQISIDDALSQKLLKVRGEKEIWQMQLKGLREILPHEYFEPIQEDIETVEQPIEKQEEMVQKKEPEEQPKEKVVLRTPDPDLKFLSAAFDKIMKRKS